MIRSANWYFTAACNMIWTTHSKIAYNAIVIPQFLQCKSIKECSSVFMRVPRGLSSIQVVWIRHTPDTVVSQGCQLHGEE